MNLYPVYLNLKDKKCLVVGGGNVAARKVASLLDAGASVCVVSPVLNEKLIQIKVANETLNWQQKDYEKGLVEGFFLVVAATGNFQTNQKIADECHENHILVNVVDNPDSCNFFVPAQIQRGDLSISISTGGKSPALSKRIRQDLEEMYHEDYRSYLDILGELRSQVLASVEEESERKKIFTRMASKDYFLLFKEQGRESFKEEVWRIIKKYNT